VPIIAKRLYRLWRTGRLARVTSFQALLSSLDSHDSIRSSLLYTTAPADGDSNEHRQSNARKTSGSLSGDVTGKLGLRATAKLSFQFCMLWFLANYFVMACLQYTTVGSTTILTSTSGVWTLIFGTVVGVEKFTFRKFLGVIASLAGIVLISRLDISERDNPPADADGSEGSFPYKTPAEIALGDAMAAFSAILYGLYTIVMKKQVGDESRVNMSLFFGLVGLFNVFLLWPGFVILHVTGIERFSLPDSSWIWLIILV
jgi:solute carrier family 35, member F5